MCLGVTGGRSAGYGTLRLPRPAASLYHGLVLFLSSFLYGACDLKLSLTLRGATMMYHTHAHTDTHTQRHTRTLDQLASVSASRLSTPTTLVSASLFLSLFLSLCVSRSLLETMARGNQRELARAKAAKKGAEANKGRKEDGLTPLQRKER